MQMTIKHPYVTFESNDHYNNVTVNFLKDGVIVEQVFSCLGPNEGKEEKYFVDMTEFLGETLDVEIELSVSEGNHTPEGELTREQIQSRLCFVRNEPSYSSIKPYCEEFRPYYHFTTLRGWINDPNGCIYYDGVYHLYYQHCPGSVRVFYENNHWSHAVSKDLISWKELQPALRYPHEASGTGFVNRETGKLNIAAGNRILESDDGGYSFRQFSVNTAGAGDPKVFWHEESKRYISVTLRHDICSYAISSSPDLVHWEAESIIGHFWECPDMAKFRIEGTDTWKWILNGADGAYMIGEFDGHVFTPDPIDPDRVDQYVPVMKRTETFSNKYNGVYVDKRVPEEWKRWYTVYAFQWFANVPDDRHVRMGWFRVNYDEVGMLFNQAMCFPQEVTLKHTPMGLRLCTQPIKEIADYYTDCRTEEGENPCVTLPSGPAFDVSVECEAGATVHLGNYTMGYSAADKRITVTQADGHSFTLPFVDDKGKIRIRALFDVMMCELYFGDGEVYFPEPNGETLDGITVSIEGKGSVRAASVGKTMITNET